MKNNIEKACFLKLTQRIVSWYDLYRRNLPWRETQDPYKIWISEIILQQTRVDQGLSYYYNFIKRFPTVKELYRADNDEVLLYWKGLGYYSRALNLHKAAYQIVEEFNGKFPKSFSALQQMKGVGKYTAAAIASICFGEAVPAIDGNFYRVFSRIFADEFDVSSTKAYPYFYQLILPLVDKDRPGDFNQAIMDIGSQLCKPKNPDCEHCPAKQECRARNLNQVEMFPVKKKKQKVEILNLQYYFIKYKNDFLIQQRDENFIWKKLYEFPTLIPDDWKEYVSLEKKVQHKLTHRTLNITFSRIDVQHENIFEDLSSQYSYIKVNLIQAQRKTFPKPLESIIQEWG
ncbi:A/G-specific adenine glycosylase [Elizabethkingia argentiflava]|uniref:Adenine DNA glycosylase n=1 Tax=Elizabethkingia argenteiflava TaxID=2681556 RepID=A0A845PXY8_9FLAO|nr:A/G-specific adenine glycosylase [Elizabethkingia argenteiflava]NAW50940.1 A/G-specific adenine glycosylase [Elizabethkingia argenteiflava]